MCFYLQPAKRSAMPACGRRDQHFSGAGLILWLLLLACVWLNPAITAVAANEAREDLSTFSLAKVPADAANGLGFWIWTDKTFDRQTCRLWKEFDVPARTKVVSARMRMTVDNGYQFSLDGRELGQGADWRGLTEYDLTLLLGPGHHVLAVNAFNDYYQAGLIMDLRVDLSDGRTLDIKSDETWRVVPEGEPGWEKQLRPNPYWAAAVIIPKNGVPQWNDRGWPWDFISVPRFNPIILPFWQTGWFHLALAFACGLIFLVCIALLWQLTFQVKQHRLLDLERARIARDIHDDFGTRLSRLVLEGEVAQNELAGDANLCARFARISNGLREALGAMDEILWAVNPRRDTVSDFVTYTCEYAQTFLRPAAIQCLLEVEPDMPALDFDLPLRRTLLLAVKEALNNVAKHSEARTMVMRIHRRESGLVVAVEDDGKGFDLAQISGGRNGLGNMVQRMNEVGGDCCIASQPGEGCRVEFSMPLTRRHSRFGWLTRCWHGRG